MFDMLFNLFKVRFIYLDNLFQKINIENRVSNVNLYINLESVLDTLHRNEIEDTLRGMNRAEYQDAHINFVSNVINLAAHYRLFFKKNKVKTNIVFFYNNLDNFYRLNNSVYVPGYRSHYAEKYFDQRYTAINNIIKNSMKYLSTIINYLDGIYILHSNRLESSVIPYLLEEKKCLPCNMKIILSKDKYDLQYVNKNFLLIYPYKDQSVILTKHNIIDFIKQKEKLKPDYPDISPLLIPFIYAVLGDRKRNLYKIKGFGVKKIYKNLVDLYEKGFISDTEPNSLTLESIAQFIKSRNGMVDTDLKERIMQNYFVVDLDRQLNISNDAFNTEIVNQLVNELDNTNLKKINNTVFANHPMQLLELNNYTNKHESIF